NEPRNFEIISHQHTEKQMELQVQTLEEKRLLGKPPGPADMGREPGLCGENQEKVLAVNYTAEKDLSELFWYQQCKVCECGNDNAYSPWLEGYTQIPRQEKLGTSGDIAKSKQKGEYFLKACLYPWAKRAKQEQHLAPAL
ncbi:hypothetical protein HGM15179_006053, partial [Zosterops borbonicus]